MVFKFVLSPLSPTSCVTLAQLLNLSGLLFSMDHTNRPYNYLLKHVSLIMSVALVPHPQNLAQHMA